MKLMYIYFLWINVLNRRCVSGCYFCGEVTIAER